MKLLKPKTKNFWFISLATITTAITLFSPLRPAQAIMVNPIYEWQFTNENGNTGNPSDIIRGEVGYEFDDSDLFPRGINPISFSITNVTGLNSSSAPFFGDGEIELNTNLVNAGTGNTFESEFDADAKLENLFVSFSGTDESFFLSFNREAFSSSPFVALAATDDIYQDDDASSFMISEQSASVPFEFSPTLGILTAGSALAFAKYRQIKQNQIKHKTT